MKLNSPKFNVIADETTKEGRICFYFGFGDDFKPTFAAKMLINGQVSSTKEKLIEDILCWISFNPLSSPLMNNQEMRRRFGLTTHNLRDDLKLIEINKIFTVFYMKNNAWYWTKSGKDLQDTMGEPAVIEINKMMGERFFTDLENLEKEQEYLTQNIKTCFSELAELEHKNSNEKIKHSLPEKPIDEFTSSVHQ